MGGAAGHMNHLYDNPELSFDEMFSIMKSASRGKLQGTEKLDGVNVSVAVQVKALDAPP